MLMWLAEILSAAAVEMCGDLNCEMLMIVSVSIQFQRTNKAKPSEFRKRCIILPKN